MATGITQAYVSMIENGHANSRINLNTLQAVAAALGERLSTLIAEAEAIPDSLAEALRQVKAYIAANE